MLKIYFLWARGIRCVEIAHVKSLAQHYGRVHFFSLDVGDPLLLTIFMNH